MNKTIKSLASVKERAKNSTVIVYIIVNRFFQTVYECIDKITQFMSRATIFSFVPVLTKILPESITCIERGRYYR